MPDNLRLAELPADACHRFDILLALIIAAVGVGGLILARRLRSLLYFSAASLLLGTDLRFVAMPRDCKVHLKHCLLCFGGYLQFDAHPRRLLGRTELLAAAQDSRHEARRPMLHELCLSSRRSSFLGRRLPHSSTALAVATRLWSRFPFCSSLSARAWLSAWPRRPANQQAGKAANQEAGTHCVPQTLKNMTESLFESKNQLSQHNIGPKSSPSR